MTWGTWPSGLKLLGLREFARNDLPPLPRTSYPKRHRTSHPKSYLKKVILASTNGKLSEKPSGKFRAKYNMQK